MRRPLAACLVFAAIAGAGSAFAAQAEKWTSIYIQGAKVGYSRAVTQEVQGQRRVETSTLIKAEMLGSRLEMTVESSTTYGAGDKPLKMEFVTSSSGRTLKVWADFTPTAIKARSESGGQKAAKTIPITPDMLIVDDPASWVAAQSKAAQQFHVFDPNSLTLVPVTARDLGQAEVTVRGVKSEGRKILVEDPRAPMTLWLDAQGEMIVAQGPMGMEMVPDTKERALALTGKADIAEASAIRSSRPLDLSKPRATLRIKGASASRFQNGLGQTTVQQGPDVVVKLEPVKLDASYGTLQVGQAGGQEAWTKPEMRVPSDSPDMKKQASALIGSEKNAIKAAEKVRQWVHGAIGVNAGIGVMRDAQEVMQTKEGVCRDHAVLMAALLRSVGIPTKLVSGIVYQGGQYYYHAWVEVWNGAVWVPMDSTRPSSRLTVGHVKIASGSVADAFVSFLIEQKVIEIVE